MKQKTLIKIDNCEKDSDFSLYDQLFNPSFQEIPEKYREKVNKPSSLTQFIIQKLSQNKSEIWKTLFHIESIIEEFKLTLSQPQQKRYHTGTNQYLEQKKNLPYKCEGSVHFVNPQSVYIGQGTLICHGAYIIGPCIIGKNCEIRKGAFIRGNVILGQNTLLGNSSEVKNSIIMDFCEIAHFNYIGDSILGIRAHFAAGSLTTNLKLDQSQVKVRYQREDNKQIIVVDTGLRKFGALIGHNVDIGGNAVLNPGSIIGYNSVIYPLASWRGTLGPNKICKVVQQQYVVSRNENKKYQ